MVLDTLGIEGCIGKVDKATIFRHHKDTRGYCSIYLGYDYVKMCQEHRALKPNWRNRVTKETRRDKRKTNLAVIESFRKITDDIKVQNNFKVWLK